MASNEFTTSTPKGTSKKRKFFKAAEYSPELTPVIATPKKAKRDHNTFDRKNVSKTLFNEPTFYDSGLEDSALYEFPDTPDRWKPLLNKSFPNYSSPETNFTRRLERNESAKFTSVKFTHKATKPKENLWNTAIDQNPELCKWIEEFNRELQMIDETELVTVSATDNE